MDIQLTLLIGAIVTIITPFIYRKTKTDIRTVLGVFFVVPILVMMIFGFISIEAADSIEAANEAAGKTITNIVEYFATKWPSAIVGDLGGAMAGALIAAFTRKKYH